MAVDSTEAYARHEVRTVVAQRDDEECRRRLELADALQRAYADALFAGDARAAELVIREAIDAGLDEGLIDDGIIGPSMALVGDLWADGELTVADEHLATEISLRVLALEREAFRVASRRAAHRVLLAGVQGEHHVIGLSMAGSVLVHAGYDVRMLGADLPMDALVHAVARHDPAVVGLTAGTPCTARLIPEAAAELRRLRPDLAVVAGGRAADDSWESSAGIIICRHVSDAVEIVDGIVQRARSN
jgi:methanogenic corrinoid protein MtbC1